MSSKEELGVVIPSFQDRSRLRDIQNGRIISVLHLDEKSKEFDCETTMFFFHGAMASHDQFAFLISHYHKYINIVAYDSYGCGNSDKPYDPVLWGESNYSAEQHTLDALAIFRRYATKRNILVGHSFGSAIVGRLVGALHRNLNYADIDQKIIGTVLLGTFKDCPLARHPIFFLPVFVLDTLQNALSAQFAELALSPKCDPEVKAWCCASSNMNQMHVAKSFYSNFGWATPTDWIELAKYPILICHGNDDLITPLLGASALHELLLLARSKATSINLHSDLDSAADTINNDSNSLEKTPPIVMEVFPDVGHQIMQEKPNELIHCMSKFLRDYCSVVDIP